MSVYQQGFPSIELAFKVDLSNRVIFENIFTCFGVGFCGGFPALSTSLCLISLFVGAVCVVVWRGSESWISIGVGGSVGWISIGGGDVACSTCSCLHRTGARTFWIGHCVGGLVELE